MNKSNYWWITCPTQKPGKGSGLTKSKRVNEIDPAGEARVRRADPACAYASFLALVLWMEPPGVSLALLAAFAPGSQLVSP